MKQTILLLMIALFSKAHAQTTISGKVRDNKNNPVAGASIAIKNSYDGGTTDSLGQFKFTTTEKGEQILIATAVGYKTFEQKINLDGTQKTIDVVIKEEINEMKAVVITAGAFEASDRKRAAAVLDPIDIVTTASANGDISGALKTLPGAQQVGESEGLFVRGGTAAETKFFIDGTLVNKFFYTGSPNIASFGRFSPFIFKGTVFSTGGYSALYGQALSSAVILESIDFPDRSAASLVLHVLGAGGGFQHLSKNKNASWGINYSYTNLGLAFKVIKQKQDYSQVPVAHNIDANFRVRTSKTGVLKYYGYFSNDRVGFTVPSIDTLGYKDYFGLKNKNLYHNLAWKENLGKGWKVNTGLSYTNNNDLISSGLKDETEKDVLINGLEFKQFGLDIHGNYFNSKLVLEKKLRGLSAVRFGSEYNKSIEQTSFTTYSGQQNNYRLKDNVFAGFAETDIYVTNNLAAKVGSRVERSSLVDQWNVAPRLSVAYKVGRGSQVSMAYGIFYQDPERRYLPGANNLNFLKASHYIAQYQKVANQQSFRAEVFYKKYHNLLKTSFNGGRETAVSTKGFGDAKGFEFFWRDKKTIKNFDYWISYSFLDTKRDYLNFPFATTPNFAAKHTASLVTKKFVQSLKMNFNSSYNYSSGRPYYHIGLNGNDYKFTERGEIPDYHNVSFAINYLPFIGKKNTKLFDVYVLQVSNIFNIKQTYGYQFSYNGMRKEAIVPPSRMFVYIGAFLNFGVDRSDEITNNL